MLGMGPEQGNVLTLAFNLSFTFFLRVFIEISIFLGIQRVSYKNIPVVFQSSQKLLTRLVKTLEKNNHKNIPPSKTIAPLPHYPITHFQPVGRREKIL